MSEKEIFANEEDVLIVDVPKEQRHLNTSSYDYSIEFIVSLMQGLRPKIVLEVPFQRKYVWKDDKASQLVESIIMNVPIPPIYFAEEEDGRWLVIDGLQRLNSLLRFSQNEFALKKLEILKELEKMKFKDLPPKAIGLLTNGQIRINVIKKDSHPDIKFDIFMRLNKGAVTLNYQELRNCLYRGNLNDLAKNIVLNNNNFLTILNLKEPHARFLDVEFIIRYFALQDALKKGENGDYYLENYKGRMVTFLNTFMDNNKILNQEKITQLRDSFETMLDKVIKVFGIEDSFKNPLEEKAKVNKALADCIMLSFDLFPLDQLSANRDNIKESLRQLLQNNEEFRSSISLRTSDKDIFNFRINKWIKTLTDALKL